MKKYLLLFIVAVAATITFNSCEKGQQGKVYLKITCNTAYCYYFSSYNDNNNSIPYGFTPGSYYECSGGTYSYNYVVESTCGYITYYFTGYYTISENPGEDWDPVTMGVLIPAADGQDKHYELYCGSTTYCEVVYKSAQPKPIEVDTTYICTGGGKMRITGTIHFGQPPAGLFSKDKNKCKN